MTAVDASTVQSISSEDRDFYEENGYLVGPVVLDPGQIERLRVGVKRIYDRQFDHHGAYAIDGPYNMDDPLGVKTVVDTWWVSDVIAELIANPSIAAITASLLRVPAVRLWQDQVIWKPSSPDAASSAKGHVGYHQDYAYWQDVSTDRMLTANIALQDTDESNGALRVLAGSHRRGLVDPEEGAFLKGDLSMADRLPEYPEKVLTVKAGQVTFHDSLMVHGSGPNTSGAPRLAVAIAYMPDGVGYRSHAGIHHSNSRYTGPRPTAGTPYTSPYFPLVFPALDEVFTPRHEG